MFRGTARERISNIFQTLLYAMILYRTEQHESMPTLYFASKMLNADYSPMILDKQNNKHIECYSSYAQEFESELTAVLDELFDFSTPFKQTDDSDACTYCDFKTICQR